MRFQEATDALLIYAEQDFENPLRGPELIEN